MSFKSIVRELKEMKDGICSMSRRRIGHTRSFIAPDVALSEPVEQGLWENLPSELLLDIIRRVEESETAWPARAVVVSCASVCRSWRGVTKEIVQTPEECGRLTFPISLKQPGPRDALVQCFIKRDKSTSTYLLYFGLTPFQRCWKLSDSIVRFRGAEDENDKLLLAARKMRKATSTDFLISLVADDFSRASNTYVGKLRSNFLGTKFTIYDSQSPNDAAIQEMSRHSRRFNAKQVSPKLPAYSNNVATISYDVRARGPRRMHCMMLPIPISSIPEGGVAPTLTSLPQCAADEKSPATALSSPNLTSSPTPHCGEPLVLKNKAPRWNQDIQGWTLNFKGRVTETSVKNFQLMAAIDHSLNIPIAEHEKAILQFGKIGKDIFTMDYCYPLSAFQAFAICLSSFDSKHKFIRRGRG